MLEVLCCLPKEPCAVPLRDISLDLGITMKRIRECLEMLEADRIHTAVVKVPRDGAKGRCELGACVTAKSWLVAQQVGNAHWEKYHDRRGDSD